MAVGIEIVRNGIHIVEAAFLTSGEAA